MNPKGKRNKSKQSTSNKKQEKPPKITPNRKTNRKFFRQVTNELGKDETHQIREEDIQKTKPSTSVAIASPQSELHRCVSEDDFKGAMAFLKDQDIDSEEKKYKAVNYTCSTSGTSVMQEAIRRRASYELMELLVFIGGKDTVIKTDGQGYNTLHHACKRGSSPEIIDVLCYAGGREALYKPDVYGDLPIHKACMKNGASTEIVKILINTGGREMLGHRNIDDKLPVHTCVYFFNTNLEVCQILVTEGLHHGVGGEAGGGGLFAEFQDIEGNNKTTLQQLKEKNLSNILLKRIGDVVSEKYGTTLTEAGAKHGLKWEKGMDALIEETDEDNLKFAMITLAASGDKADLTAIYELTKRYTGLLFD